MNKNLRQRPLVLGGEVMAHQGDEASRGSWVIGTSRLRCRILQVHKVDVGFRETFRDHVGNNTAVALALCVIVAK